MKLSPCECLHLVKIVKISLCENDGVYSNFIHWMFPHVLFSPISSLVVQRGAAMALVTVAGNTQGIEGNNRLCFWTFQTSNQCYNLY